MADSDAEKTTEEMAKEHGGIWNTLEDIAVGLINPPVIKSFQKLHGLAATSLRDVTVGERGNTEEVYAIIHDDTVWVLEVSGMLKGRHVERAREKARKVRTLPEFQDKKVVPVVAGTRIPDSVRARAREAGVEVFRG